MADAVLRKNYPMEVYEDVQGTPTSAESGSETES
jgi:hypothetical protein